MDVSLHHPDDSLVRPWRLAAIIAAGVAALELLVLVIVGGALIAKPAKPGTHRPAKAKAAVTAKATLHLAAPVKIHRTPPPAAKLARRKVTVLVLNGNGRQGAAASAAARVSHHGYRIGGVSNAGRTDFTRSLVMYRRGFEGEGRRLARDLGIGIVGPLDGIKAAQLHGANAVLVVGA